MSSDALARIGDITSLTANCSHPHVPTVVQICGAFGHPRNLRGGEGVSYIIYDHPELLHEIVENWCDLYIELITKLASLIRVDGIVIWEDMCFKNGPLINPHHFRNSMLPRYRRFIDAARACGVESLPWTATEMSWK